MNKIFFLVFCFVFHVQLIAEYFLMEEELVQLEKISGELKASNQHLQKQVTQLKITVSILKKASKAKEDLLKSLKTSFEEFESEVMLRERQQNEKISSLTFQLTKTKKWLNFWCALSICLITGFIAFKLLKAGVL